MEITKREIIVSVSIVFIMLLFGFIIGNKITESHVDDVEKYNKAIKINTTELFQYAMDTNVGNAFVEGEMIALDPVTYEAIGGEYLSVERVKEEYRNHPRPVTRKDAKGKSHTKMEDHWTWDTMSTDSKSATKVTFCGIEFSANKFSIGSGSHIDTIYTSSHVRYKYSGFPVKSTGSIFAYLANKDIKDTVSYHEGMTNKELYKSLISNWGIVVFWIIWIIFIALVVAGFFYFENNWLE